METLKSSEYGTVAAAHFTDQNWIPKTDSCIKCVMDFKIDFTNWNAKIALLRASMVVTYYIKLFRTQADRHKSSLMSLLLLVSETIIPVIKIVTNIACKRICMDNILVHSRVVFWIISQKDLSTKRFLRNAWKWKINAETLLMVLTLKTISDQQRNSLEIRTLSDYGPDSI